ncbi:MAG: dienelactone hydrolase family protein [Gammaproteobacteria bacterium]|nr:dienelactone hydrolase family protein [Gammaproteobacteria bacterium]
MQRLESIRRLLAMTLALCLCASGAVAAQGRMVQYQVDGADYEGYFVSPGNDAPLVLLIHDWDGLTDYEVKRAEMLAEMGYAVFAADLFGAGVRPTKVEDKRQHTGELYKDRAKMRALMNGALAEAGRLGAATGDAVAMGYCFGGAAVLELARSGAPLKGFATFHGGLKTPEGQDYKNARGAILVMHGSADTAITMDQFAALTNELEAAGVAHEMITYSGAPHAFTVFGSDRYRADADQKSWRRFSEFLSTTLQR